MILADLTVLRTLIPVTHHLTGICDAKHEQARPRCE